jgi:hypothetical protein
MRDARRRQKDLFDEAAQLDTSIYRLFVGRLGVEGC